MDDGKDAALVLPEPVLDNATQTDVAAAAAAGAKYIKIVSQAIMRLTVFHLPGSGCSVLSWTKS